VVKTVDEGIDGGIGVAQPQDIQVQVVGRRYILGNTGLDSG
jgi:hypothetical protein